jgi:hypothetical protein
VDGSVALLESPPMQPGVSQIEILAGNWPEYGPIYPFVANLTALESISGWYASSMARKRSSVRSRPGSPSNQQLSGPASKRLGRKLAGNF